MIKTIEIESLTEFIALVNKYSLRSRTRLRLYRGQENINWDLIPKLARNGYSYEKFQDIEIKIIEEFERHSYQYDKGMFEYDEWELLALAQHYGLPTRLLDWTSNPLTALWFAFKNEKSDDEERVVWGLSIKEEELADTSKEPFEQKFTMAFQPIHINRRISAQSGWFTVHKLNVRNNIIPLNKQVRYNKRLVKFVFSNDNREKILKQLDVLGVNNMSMFPDLDGV